MAHPQIAVFARMAKENTQPTRVVAGQKTLLARTMHDIRYDEIHDEILVTNPFAQAILVFRGGSNGDEKPLRIIQGPKTQLKGGSGGNGVDRLDVDPIHNEIYIPAEDKVLVFPREANGDVAPIRVIEGPNTGLDLSETLAVDPVSNVLVVGTVTPYRPQGRPGGMLIFNRTDSGNAKPKGVIRGPKTGIVRINQIQMYPPKGWIVGTQPGPGDVEEPEGVYVGVWHISDSGDVPPRWKIAGPKSLMKKPRGVAFDLKHKELIVADMRLNAVLTYYFPEMF